MFLRNCWYVAGWSHQFATDRPVARTMLGEPIVLYRKDDGGIAALEDRCCHRLAPLSKGRIEGDDLRCMYHGLKFAPSGRCVEIPGQRMVPPRARVRAYPAVEQDCWVWLWMGDPALADTALIPRALNHGDPDWWMQTGQLAYAANYQLINDNLLDLAHLSYVHENTLGRSSMSWAESKPTVTPIPRGLRIARWVVNNPRPRYLTVPGGASHIDMWASHDYMVPGIFLLGTRTYPVGTAAVRGMQAPDPDAAPLTTTTSQAVTPIDEQHTIYYYSGCLPRRLASEEDSRQQFALFERAFAEDNAMIEAQERVIARTPQPRMLWIRADRALNQFRGLMDELMAEGSEPAANRAPLLEAAEG
ncbi:MAG: aromatic ring-hydroxylating dioxygenase subunit alpha [Alphaproteobacteria bacterium]|nr:aromatic ring-hydroxylating dioxygenase subunit alpha [Alphaproteobacteria bacterium]